MVAAVGHSRHAGPDYVWNGRDRGSTPFAVIQSTIDGAGTYSTPSAVHTVGPGQAMVALIPGDHEYRVSPDAECWDFAFAVVYGREAMRLLGALVEREGPVVSWQDNSRADLALYDLAHRLLEGPRPSSYELSAGVYSLVMAMLAPAPVSTSARIDQAVATIHARLESTLTVDELARGAGLSRFHFSRLFSEHTGLSPAPFLHEARMERATSLLASGGYTVKETAGRCGFQSSSYFCRVFKESTGMTPQEYQKSRGGYR
jgi:AraC-like DNA-binding protein